MKRITSRKEEMELVRSKIQELIKIVSELETEFPGRHFTIDGHLVCSIGEVMAAYYYGIDLYEASTENMMELLMADRFRLKLRSGTIL